MKIFREKQADSGIQMEREGFGDYQVRRQQLREDKDESVREENTTQLRRGISGVVDAQRNVQRNVVTVTAQNEEKKEPKKRGKESRYNVVEKRRHVVVVAAGDIMIQPLRAGEKHGRAWASSSLLHAQPREG
ncbi:hypothetical protein ACOSP7_023363 [Xanthoceras sorbifolium]